MHVDKPFSLPKLAMVALGLAIAYLPAYIHQLLDSSGIQIGPDGPPSVLLWNWLAVALLLGYILSIERRRLASILLVKANQQDSSWALRFWGFGLGVSWSATLLFPPPPNQGTNDLLSYSLPILIGMIFTAAVTEEILYRGYPIERIGELTGKPWVAIAISFVIFILPHLTFFGVEWLLYHSSGTILIYILYVWRKNLYASMVLHLLGNLPILLPALGLVA